MLYIPHGEGEIGGWKTKTKKLKVVVGSNRVLLHGTLAEQLHHPFSFVLDQSATLFLSFGTLLLM